MNISPQKVITPNLQDIQSSSATNNYFDAVIFDCDGVLVDSEEIANRIEVEELNIHGCPISVREYNDRFAGITTKDAFDTLAKENNITFHSGFVKSVEKKTLDFLEKEDLSIPGVRHALEEIYLPKAVASNAYNEKLHTLLRINNLLPYFNGHIFSADLVNHPKPYPDIYELAADAMGVSPRKCLVIEDSEAGVKAARAAGMHVFGFIRGYRRDSNYVKVLEEAGSEVIFNDMLVLPKLISLYIPTV